MVRPGIPVPSRERNPPRREPTSTRTWADRPLLVYTLDGSLLGGMLESRSLLSARPVFGQFTQVETLSRTQISTAIVTYLWYAVPKKIPRSQNDLVECLNPPGCARSSRPRHLLCGRDTKVDPCLLDIREYGRLSLKLRDETFCFMGCREATTASRPQAASTLAFADPACTVFFNY